MVERLSQSSLQKKRSSVTIQQMLKSLTESYYSDDDEELTDWQALQENNERNWSLPHLIDQFEALKLENLFAQYTKKINQGYFSLFLILQTCLSITHTLLLVLVAENFQLVIPDLILYAFTSILAIICFVLSGKLTKVDNYWKISVFLTFLYMNFLNFFLPIFHFFQDQEQLRPAYTTVIILSCYVFFHIFNTWAAVSLAGFASLLHIVLTIFITYKGNGEIWRRTLSDSIYIVCINGLGVYFSYLNEIIKRKSFLDRRSCISSNLQLSSEEQQQEQLTLSIIPSNVLEEIKKKIKEQFFPSENQQNSLIMDPVVQSFNNVTILFADIVNYTAMTKKLPTSLLLDTLDDLFGKFDTVSEKLGVVRIKFLGDCYYCVSGLPPDPPENHAEACVDLGLQMIKIISAVRVQKKVNVNMRIGVHSGNIYGGIMGIKKYQFDVWSRDVNIANIMESEGEAGMVHISNTTKELLKKEYQISENPKTKSVEIFKKENITTYLIAPEKEVTGRRATRFYSQIKDAVSVVDETRRSSLFRKKNEQTTFLSQMQLNAVGDFPEEEENCEEAEERERSMDEDDSEDDDYPEGPTFIDLSHSKRPSEKRSSSQATHKSNRRTSAIEQRISRQTGFMNSNIKKYRENNEKAFEEMEQTVKELSFSKYSQYVKEKQINALICFNDFFLEMDYLKMPDHLFKYYLLSEIVLLVCVYILQNLTLSSWDFSSWSFYTTTAMIVFIFTPLSWTHHLWTRKNKNKEKEPCNKFLRFFYKSSLLIRDSFMCRFIIYTTVCALFGYCVLSEVIECKLETNKQLRSFLNLQATDIDVTSCVIPWHMTETCALAIVMTFLFLKMWIWIKFFYALVITALYSYCIVNISKTFYIQSETFNIGLSAQTAHIISVVFLMFTLILIDRQTDYMNKLDYLSYKSLLNKTVEINEIHKINDHLLRNILPKHVAKIYMDVNRKEGLYSHKHKKVCVMFASLLTENVQSESEIDDITYLKILNQFIVAFDTICNRKDFVNVEKIKMAKGTYMAACGLKEPVTYDPIKIMVEFAAEMLKSNSILNQQTFSSPDFIKLRIGICHGSVMAGVVGSKKPLYDIWGDAVNMASRMDTTGEANRIQVMEKTYKKLKLAKIKCEERGEVFVKGRKNKVVTYFVCLDQQYDIIRE